jgi:oxygen-independent coproporphyrinogen-3 oxidase
VRCGYCDFNTYTATELRGARQDAYADEVLREIALSRDVLAARGPLRAASTVFFGGGTPTLLPAGDLARMLGGVRDTFGLASDAEVTVEANPDTVTPRSPTSSPPPASRVCRSVCSRPFRMCSPRSTGRTTRRTSAPPSPPRGAGLDISVDLIYGAPGESLGDWRTSVETAIALAPDHISAYALIIEEGTQLHRQIRRGDVAAPDDDLQADMYELVDDLLASAGFAWYEVSNWATSPAHRSRHNLAYWRGTDWWGYGPGAHSHVSGCAGGTSSTPRRTRSGSTPASLRRGARASGRRRAAARGRAAAVADRRGHRSVGSSGRGAARRGIAHRRRSHRRHRGRAWPRRPHPPRSPAGRRRRARLTS